MPALRAFLDGERAIDGGRWEDARLAFGSAIAADSSFWLAYFRYALAHWWDALAVEPEVEQALRLHGLQLHQQERMLVNAFLTGLDSMPLRIERHRLVTERYPEYSIGWFLYGDALFHFGSERGYDWHEAVSAFRRAAALRPRLAAAWTHILDAALGKDLAETGGALARLTQLGWTPDNPDRFRLMLAVDSNGGVVPPGLDWLADTLADHMATADEQAPQGGFFGLIFLMNGFPAAQVDLNGRALRAKRLPTEARIALRAATAWSWAARGQWDSALTLLQEVATEHPGPLGPPRRSYNSAAPIGGSPFALESYGLAAVGAWMGAVTPAQADRRRGAAVLAINDLGDEDTRRDARAGLAWFDGLLAFVRRDPEALALARRDATGSGYYLAGFVDSSLAAFGRALVGESKRAGQELANLELWCIDHIKSCNGVMPPTGVQRLAAAQWLAEAGDIEQARRLLRWHDAEPTYIPPFPWSLVFVLGGPTYLARARLEELHGDPGRAREYYLQFLRRYDQPMPAQEHLVEEARAALARLSGGEGAASR
jgi:tetratricopeptide (TPR) repeat protein